MAAAALAGGAVIKDEREAARHADGTRSKVAEVPNLPTALNVCRKLLRSQ
jgi:hypothetical protein